MIRQKSPCCISWRWRPPQHLPSVGGQRWLCRESPLALGLLTAGRPGIPELDVAAGAARRMAADGHSRCEFASPLLTSWKC